MNLLDIVIVILSFTCLFLYADRARLVGIFLKKLDEAKHNEFINFFHLFYTDWTFTILAALLVFLATFRLWKLLKFMLIIKIVEKTLFFCFKPIICLCLWQFMILLSYGIAGMILFGDDSYGFRQLTSSIITLLVRSLGFENHFNIDGFQTRLQYVYYISFMIINLLINTLYIAIITISYNDAQIYYSNVEEYTVIDFFKEKLYFYFKLFQVRIRNYRLRGGKNMVGKEMVYPKLDEHRFAQCITSPKNKIEAMLFVTLCMLRKLNKNKLKELNIQDRELIKNTIVCLFRDDRSDNDIFYVSNLQGFEKTMVDDKVFIKMERIVQYLLTKEKLKRTDKQKRIYKEVCRFQKQKMEKMNESLELVAKILNQIEFD